MELFQDFLLSLLKLSPVVGLLLIAIYYLFQENKTLKVKNEELNTFVRDEATKNVAVLSTVTNTMDKLIDDANNNNQSLKEWLSLKLDNLNGKSGRP